MRQAPRKEARIGQAGVLIAQARIRPMTDAIVVARAIVRAATKEVGWSDQPVSAALPPGSSG